MPEDDERIGQVWGRDMDDVFFEFAERDYLDESEIRYVRTKFTMDPHVQRELYDLSDKPEFSDPENGGEPGANRAFLKEFWGIMEKEYSALLRSLDPKTRAAALASKPARWYKPWPIFSEHLWTSWIRPGNDGYVYGPKGTGKTDFMCLLAQLFIGQGGTVVSGIPLRHESKRYIYVTRGTQLLRISCGLALEGIPSFVLFDEGFIHSSGERPLDSEVMNVRQFGRVFRKLGIASLWGSQRESDILKDIRQDAAIRVAKRSKVKKDQAHIQIQGETSQALPTIGERVRILEFSDYIKWIPPTSLPFRTEAIATFVMDFEPVHLMNYLADLPMEENQYRATLSWLDKRGYHYSRDMKVDLARKIAREGISLVKTARILDVAETTVRRYLASGK